MATQVEPQTKYSTRINELRRFDETKAGVKGLVDGGITQVPPMFFHPPDDSLLGSCPNSTAKISVPTIDLDGVGNDPIRHKQIVAQIRDASESWGFFRVINHGIPREALDDVIEGTRRFHEQDVDIKAQYYTREDTGGLAAYCSNFHLYRLPEAEWRDMFSCSMAPVAPIPEDLHVVCREILIEYSKQVRELGESLFRLLSEGLGLNQNHLLDIGCHEGLILIGHYYPPCPEPERTLGIRKHSDNNFMTILVQDHVGGLQVMHQNQWVDVEPIPGALVVNIGNILQIISNDKFKSVEHRVLANSVGPRISMASFFSALKNSSQRVYGPIEDLLSEEDNPPRYPSITTREFFTSFLANASDGVATLRHLSLHLGTAAK